MWKIYKEMQPVVQIFRDTHEILISLCRISWKLNVYWADHMQPLTVRRLATAVTGLLTVSLANDDK